MDLKSCNSWPFYALILLLPLIYWYKYLNRYYNYWTKKGIKGPWPIPGYGTYLYYLLESRSSIEIKWLRKYGKIYGVYEGNRPVLRVAEPELIKQILVKDFHCFIDRLKNPNLHPIADKTLEMLNGEDWKRVRSILSPTFTSGKLKKMFPLIRQCLKDFMSALDKKSIDGQELDMKRLYGKYSLDVLSCCAFATKTDLYNDSNNEFMAKAVEAFKPNYLRLILNLTLPNLVLKYFKITFFISNEVREYFYDIIRGILKQRKNSDKGFNDFIELMLNYKKNEVNVRDDNDINESHHVNEGEEELIVIKKTLTGVEKYLTENEVIANAFTFLLAGYETTATTLSHCTQELALNPEVQEILYLEIISSVDSNGEIDYHLLTKLPYLDAVISETLRLHSPSIALARMALKDYKLGDTGITIIKGQRVEIPIYAIHRCEEYYPNADQFIPERFLPENRHKIIPYTYLPFGGGPRNCIGMRFALLEAKLALAHVIQNFKILKSANTDIPVLLTKNLFLHSPQRVIVSMVKRP